MFLIYCCKPRPSIQSASNLREVFGVVVLTFRWKHRPSTKISSPGNPQLKFWNLDSYTFVSFHFFEVFWQFPCVFQWTLLKCNKWEAMKAECWYTGHKQPSQPTKTTTGYWKVTTEMPFPMSWYKKTWCYWHIPARWAALKKNHEPTLSCLFISEVLRTLFNIVTDWCWARPKTSFILQVLSFNTSGSGKIIYCTFTVTRVFQEPGPLEK